MNNRCAVVHTFKSIENILRAGGTESWRMDPVHFGTFQWAICTRNARSQHVEGSEPHNSAFLMGKVSEVILTTDPGVLADMAKGSHTRYQFKFSEAAIIRPPIPLFWKWGRWPVHLDDLDVLGVDPADYEFKPLDEILAEIAPRTDIKPEAIITSPSDFMTKVEEAKAAAKLLVSTRLGIPSEKVTVSISL